MKHSLLFILMGLMTTVGYAQTCTPDANYSNAAPGLYPDGPLGPTCDLVAAKTIVGLTDTVVSVTNPIPITATLYITRLRINSVTGLPSGLAVSTDVIGTADANAPWGYWDNTGTVPNQTSALGCAYVYGSGGDWDAAVGGGPNNDGEYPLIFEVDAYVASADPAFVSSFIGLPAWVSTIDPGVGGGSFLIYDTLVVASDYADISTTIIGTSNVNPGSNYNYQVPNEPGVNYNWSVTNGTIVSGQGTNSIIVTWNGSGSVQVDLTDGGCQGTDNLAVTALATGIDAVAQINAEVFPNPSNGMFNITVGTTDVLNIRVMDLSGKVISTKQLAGSNLYSYDMMAVPAGAYLMEIESANGRTFKRLVKN